MGATACAHGKCQSDCCSSGAQSSTTPLEYQPAGTRDTRREYLEPGLPPVAACSETVACAQVNDAETQNYFARELAELRKSPQHLADGRRPPHTFQSGATYWGEWRSRDRHGFGQQRWRDGAQYTGQWSKSLADGNGQLEYTDGDRYVGQFYRGTVQGLGVYYDSKGCPVYRGNWVESMEVGLGEESVGGARFLGEHVDSKKQGSGVFEWPDKSQYFGQWEHGCINGYGHYLGKDGRTFRGMWRNAKIHGCGKYSWPDGRSYCGQYEYDQKHGFGVFTWNDGLSFAGYWKDGKQHGQGRFCDSDGKVLKQGLWDMGVPVEDDPAAKQQQQSGDDAGGPAAGKMAADKVGRATDAVGAVHLPHGALATSGSVSQVGAAHTGPLSDAALG